MKTKTNFFLFLPMLCLTISTILAQTPQEQIDQALSTTYENGKVPGFAVSIVSKDAVLYQNAFGYADVENKKPYTVNTIQNIGSISKTFIGVALLQLVEQGILNLDDDINQVLPFKVTNPYHPSTAITLRQLTTHTASINDGFINYDAKAYYLTNRDKSKRKKLPFWKSQHFKMMEKNKHLPLGDYLKKVLSTEGKWYRKKNFHKAAPGTKEDYSNIGAALAAYLIEVVTGMPYAEYVRQNILHPLGMNASGWTYKEIDKTHLAERYIKDKAVPDYLLNTYPDGGLMSSNKDMTVYLMAMLKGYYDKHHLLSPASFQNLMTNQFEQAPLAATTPSIEKKAGMFWEYIPSNNIDNIGHAGSDPGILCLMFFDPQTGLGYMISINAEDQNYYYETIKAIWDVVSESRSLFAE